MNRWIIVVTAIAFILVGGAAGYTALTSHRVIPDAIAKQASSAVIAPTGKAVRVDRQSFKINDAEKLLTFTATYEGKILNVSEQPTPESFTDIPQAFDSLVSQMGEYGKFESILGTVHLTSPKQQPTIQIAVLNAKGTLTFVKSNGGMTKEHWAKFFTTFDVVK